MSKSITFKRPGKTPTADQWVETRPPLAGGTKETKRFTFDIPVDLHRRVRLACFERDVHMSDMVRELLAREFPPTDGNAPSDADVPSDAVAPAH